MRRAAEEAAAGSVRVVVLTGPFGFGRSRMLDTVADAAAGLGFGRVVRAACSPERRSPLRPLRRAFDGVPGLERVCEAMDRASAVDPLATRGGQDALMEAVEEELVEASLREATLITLTTHSAPTSRLSPSSASSRSAPRAALAAGSSS